MPTLLVKYGYRFHFVAGDHGEPPHVHVDGHGGTAKFWLDDARLVYAHGIKRHDLKRISRTIIEQQSEMLEAWNEFLG